MIKNAAKRYIVVIGSSTGGPLILQDIFTGFPRVDASILICQHLPPAFLRPFASHIRSVTAMPVEVAEAGLHADPGIILVARPGWHLLLQDNRVCRLQKSAPVNFVRPSIDVLMQSILPRTGDAILGIILTGMGRDGAEGIRHIHSLGGRTIAQDPETCPIRTMPLAAIETGAVSFVLSPQKIREYLIQVLPPLKR